MLVTKQDVSQAYLRMRKIDNTIPDEVLDFLKDSALKCIAEQTKRRDGFARIAEVFDAMQMERVQESPEIYEWVKIVIANDEFPLWDYGRGLLRASIGLTFEDDLYKVMLHFGNIDDGDWIAVESSGEKTPEACFEKMDKLAKEILAPMVKVPSEKELNEMLRPYGMYGVIE